MRCSCPLTCLSIVAAETPRCEQPMAFLPPQAVRWWGARLMLSSEASGVQESKKVPPRFVTVYDAVEHLVRISDDKETLDWAGYNWPQPDEGQEHDNIMTEQHGPGPTTSEHCSDSVSVELIPVTTMSTIVRTPRPGSPIIQPLAWRYSTSLDALLLSPNLSFNRCS